ncbi:hypothetical protein T10_12833 [Trichinella papuae]|uniref:Uncharacterized protein n=1 Tax=Trichinella papuae TaxID=268474 RepID=A0A0V1MGZ3_9BILA|nr:hypothetical protein T10_12833 [Trichinella papuae]
MSKCQLSMRFNLMAEQILYNRQLLRVFDVTFARNKLLSVREEVTKSGGAAVVSEGGYLKPSCGDHEPKRYLSAQKELRGTVIG